MSSYYMPYLSHSYKGSSWKKHTYESRSADGKYTYPKDYRKNRGLLNKGVAAFDSATKTLDSFVSDVSNLSLEDIKEHFSDREEKGKSRRDLEGTGGQFQGFLDAGTALNGSTGSGKGSGKKKESKKGDVPVALDVIDNLAGVTERSVEKIFNLGEGALTKVVSGVKAIGSGISKGAEKKAAEVKRYAERNYGTKSLDSIVSEASGKSSSETNALKDLGEQVLGKSNIYNKQGVKANLMNVGEAFKKRSSK